MRYRPILLIVLLFSLLSAQQALAACDAHCAVAGHPQPRASGNEPICDSEDLVSAPLPQCGSLVKDETCTFSRIEGDAVFLSLSSTEEGQPAWYPAVQTASAGWILPLRRIYLFEAAFRC